MKKFVASSFDVNYQRNVFGGDKQHTPNNNNNNNHNSSKLQGRSKSLVFRGNINNF